MTEQLTNEPGTIDAADFLAVSRFLAWEAKLLDERRLQDWVKLLDADFVYDVPLRAIRMKYEDETADGGFHIRDDVARILSRIRRLESAVCWAESPPSRTLRVIGSILVDAGEQADEFEVESALLLYRQRGSTRDGDVVAVRRYDRLRRTPEGFKLAARRALLTDSVLRTPNLDVFL